LKGVAARVFDPLGTLATGYSTKGAGKLVYKYRFFKLKAFPDLPAAMRAEIPAY
jgi:hypothetical protein